MKRYSAFPKAPETGNSPSNCLVSYTRHSLGESYLPAEKQSEYSTTTSDRSTGHSLGESYPSAEMRSLYSTVQPTGQFNHFLHSGASYINNRWGTLLLPIKGTPVGTTIPGHRRPGGNANKRIHPTPQRFTTLHVNNVTTAGVRCESKNR